MDPRKRLGSGEGASPAGGVPAGDAIWAVFFVAGRFRRGGGLLSQFRPPCRCEEEFRALPTIARPPGASKRSKLPRGSGSLRWKSAFPPSFLRIGSGFSVPQGPRGPRPRIVSLERKIELLAPAQKAD